MSTQVQREIRIIPDVGDTVTSLNLVKTSEPIRGTLNLAAVPVLTCLSFPNQDVTKLYNLDLNVSLQILNISNNTNLSFNFNDYNLTNKPLNFLNVTNTQCSGSINILSDLNKIEFFHAANTQLEGDITLPSTLKSINVRNCQISGTLASIANVPNLVELDCSNNKIFGTTTILAAPKLTALRLNNNNLGRVINKTNVALLSNIKVFDLSNNNLANTGADGLTDVYTWLAYFKRLKLDYGIGGPGYVLNLSGSNMPALSNANLGNVNLLISEDYNTLTSAPNPWTVTMGSRPVRESQQSIGRATTIANADPQVREYVRDWERTKNEVIPTRDIQLVDRKVRLLKTVTPEITGSGVSVLVSPNVWLSGSMWDLVGLNFEPDPDHNNYIDDFLGGNTLLSKPTSLIYYLELLWFIKTMKWLGIWNDMLAWPLGIYQYRNLYTGSDLSFVKVRALGGGGVNKSYSGVNKPAFGHILNFYYGTSAQPETNQFTVQVLSAFGGIPLSRGSITLPRFRPVTVSLTPPLSWDNGFFFYTSIYNPVVITDQEIIESRDNISARTASWRRTLFSSWANASLWDWPTFSGEVYQAVTQHWPGNIHSMKVRKSDFWERDRTNFRTVNPVQWPGGWRANDFEWPVSGRGWRLGLSWFKSQSLTRADLSSWRPWWEFNNNGHATATTAVNDPYFNTYSTPAPLPYVDDTATTFDWNRRPPVYGYTNWRDIRVSFVSGINSFYDEDNLLLKFYNPGGYSTNALPVTSLSYRYKNFWVNIEYYTASTRTIRINSPWAIIRLGHIEIGTEIKIFNAVTGLRHVGKVQSINLNVENPRTWVSKIVDIVLETDVIGSDITAPGSRVFINTPSLNEEGGTFIREWDSMSHRSGYAGNVTDATYYRNRSYARDASDSLNPGGNAAPGQPHRTPEYVGQSRSAEDFLTPHFVFNNTLTSLTNTISSIYLCGRYLNNFSTFSPFIDERPAIDKIRLDNSGPNYGTLVIENTANGNGMVFDVLDIIPEKRYRILKTRRPIFSDIWAPVDRYYSLLGGFGTDNTAYLGVDHRFYGGLQDPADVWLSRAAEKNAWGETPPAPSRDGQLTVFSVRDPIQNVKFNPMPWIPDFYQARTQFGGAGQFSLYNFTADRYDPNSAHNSDRFAGYCRFIMIGNTSFTMLTSNNFLRANTMHRAITSFFFETSGFDLTPSIGSNQPVDFVISEPNFGAE